MKNRRTNTKYQTRNNTRHEPHGRTRHHTANGRARAGAVGRRRHGHDWLHIERVRRTALAIGREERADLFIVELAALLHDVADWKFAGGDHEAGPRQSRAWLRVAGCCLGDDRSCLRHHRRPVVQRRGRDDRQWPRLRASACKTPTDSTPSARSASPARSPTAATRARPSTTPSVRRRPTIRSTPTRRGSASTINHFYEKLLLLRDRMNTATGRRLAAERHRVPGGLSGAVLRRVGRPAVGGAITGIRRIQSSRRIRILEAPMESIAFRLRCLLLHDGLNPCQLRGDWPRG